MIRYVAPLIAGCAVALAVPAQADITGFSSPSGNIYCMIDPAFVRCDIRDRDWSPPPRPADCPSFTGYGQGIEISAGQAPRFVCAGDTTFNTNTLAYGDAVTAGALRCTSAESGITCRDTGSGHGSPCPGRPISCSDRGNRWGS